MKRTLIQNMIRILLKSALLGSLNFVYFCLLNRTALVYQVPSGHQKGPLLLKRRGRAGTPLFGHRLCFTGQLLKPNTPSAALWLEVAAEM